MSTRLLFQRSRVLIRAKWPTIYEWSHAWVSSNCFFKILKSTLKWTTTDIFTILPNNHTLHSHHNKCHDRMSGAAASQSSGSGFKSLLARQLTLTLKIFRSFSLSLHQMPRSLLPRQFQFTIHSSSYHLHYSLTYKHHRPINHSFHPLRSVLRKFHSLFQSEFSTQCDLVPPLSVSTRFLKVIQ